MSNAITIKTNNVSRTLRNSNTFVDNWVYIPGSAITGDYSQPMLFENLNDFINTCGDHGVIGSKTFEYVCGVLSAGLPVIFRRIACDNQDGTHTAGDVYAVQAYTTLTHTETVESEEVTITDVTIKEKFGGSFGNNMFITVRIYRNTYYIDVYYGSSLLESKKVCSYTDAELETESTTHIIAQRIISTLPTLEFERIVVHVDNTSAASFKFEPVTKKPLSGGVDYPEANVAAQIPASYNYIKDKLLFQPKFLTSGGYTDADLTTSSAIATAMKELSKTRQDCRALIDIALGTAASEQKTQATAVGYTQSADNEEIPDAMVITPWCYTQVGNEQLWMPGSYLYLTKVGSDLSKGTAAYTPKAGLANGQLSGIIKPQFEIGSDLASSWQTDGDVQLNPILRLQGGRYIIAGNSTLLDTDPDEENALIEASASMAVLEIRRFAYNLATELQYQYNSTVAFETYALRTEEFLDKMKADGAITSYTITNTSTAEDPRVLKIKQDVWVSPTIKSIEINLNIGYGDVTMTTGGEV